MSQLSGSPSGVGGSEVGGGVGASQNTMPADTGGPATQDAVAVPQFTGMMNSMANMLGKTKEERTTNAKALAAVVKDLGSLATTASETTLLQRMMEAQGSGIGFVSAPGSGPGIGDVPRSFSPAAAAPVMSQVGFTGR
jgi:hypothetical protein